MWYDKINRTFSWWVSRLPPRYDVTFSLRGICSNQTSRLVSKARRLGHEIISDRTAKLESTALRHLIADVRGLPFYPPSGRCLYFSVLLFTVRQIVRSSLHSDI
jgi:hypothetical protein